MTTLGEYIDGMVENVIKGLKVVDTKARDVVKKVQKDPQPSAEEEVEDLDGELEELMDALTQGLKVVKDHMALSTIPDKEKFHARLTDLDNTIAELAVFTDIPAEDLAEHRATSRAGWALLD